MIGEEFCFVCLFICVPFKESSDSNEWLTCDLCLLVVALQLYTQMGEWYILRPGIRDHQ